MELKQTANTLLLRVTAADKQFFNETGLPVVAHGLKVANRSILDRVVARPIAAGRGNNYSNPDGVRDGNTAAACRAVLEKTGLVVYVPLDRMSTGFFSDVISRSRVVVADELQPQPGSSSQLLVNQVIPETGIQIRFDQT